MKLKVNRKKFIEELRIGSMAVAKGKTNIPVLLYTRIQIEGNKLYRLFSSDSSQTINYTGIVENIVDYSSEYSDFMIDAKEFIAILSSIKDEYVCLEILTSKNCVILHDKGQITLPVYPVDKYTPVMDIKDNSNNYLRIETEQELSLFANKLKRACDFTGSDAYRPVLNGVYINAHDGLFDIAATNSFIMYSDSINCSENFSFDAIIPSLMVNNIVSLLSLGSDVRITLESGKLVMLFANNIKYSCSVIDGKYPAYKSVIPKDIKIRVEVDKEELKEAVKRQVYTTDYTNKCILRTQEIRSSLEIESSNTDTGKENHEIIPASVKDQMDFSIAIKTEYLLTGIDCVENSSITLQFTEINKPVLIQENTMSIVIMPLSLN